MENLVRVGIVMEMVAVNLLALDVCAHRKLSKLKTFLVILAFTATLNFLTHGLWSRIGFDDGNAVFAFIGIVYLVPLWFLYKEPLSHITSILFSAWLYTMLGYCLSVHFSILFKVPILINGVLLFQSIFYAVTLLPFFCWVRRGFLYTLKNITRGSRHILQAVSLSWFIAIAVIHACTIYKGNRVLNVAAIAVVAVNAVLSYLLIHSIAANQHEVKNLEFIVYTDNLTKLPNRARLFLDVPRLIQSYRAFRLCFIDLDRFKSINDQYGHQMGDEYLICFSKLIVSLLLDGECLYRMSGDEFIIISQGGGAVSLADRLGECPDKLCGPSGIPFLGFSIGWADYPLEDSTLDGLITLADNRMYQNKPMQVRQSEP